MGGASVAAPIDSIGAIYWNPASISGLASSETSFGLGLLMPNHTVSSTFPGLGSGSTEADAGIFPVPNIGWVHLVENSIDQARFYLGPVPPGWSHDCRVALITVKSWREELSLVHGLRKPHKAGAVSEKLRSHGDHHVDWNFALLAPGKQ